MLIGPHFFTDIPHFSLDVIAQPLMFPGMNPARATVA
jgi:hypothetical protein